jgi:hypothetical protein
VLGAHAQRRRRARRHAADAAGEQAAAIGRAQRGLAFGAAAQHVVVADEAGHERVRRRVVQLLRRGELLDAPVVEHGDAV